MKKLCAELNTFVPGRPVDDDGAAMMRMEQGVRALLSASQVAVGEANNINIRVYGEKGGIEWIQENPNQLFLKKPNIPEVLHIGKSTLPG